MADAKVQVDPMPDSQRSVDEWEESAVAGTISARHTKDLKKVAGNRHKAHDDGEEGHSHHGHAEKKPSFLTAFAAAVINFLLMFGLCCAYGIIMFEDKWNAKHRGMAVKMNLCTALVLGLLLASGSKLAVSIGGPDLNPVVFLGMFVQTIADAVAKDQGLVIPNESGRRLMESYSALVDLDPLEALRRLGDESSSGAVEFCKGTHYVIHTLQCDTYHDELRATTIFAVSVSSLILGLIFFCLGRFRMTRFVTYVPTNIMEAFLSCVGYKVFKYALKFCKYKPQQFIPAMCIGVPLYFMKVLHLGNPAIVIPMTLLIPLGIFYAVVYGQGGSVETARTAGWMFDELENADFWSVWTYSLGKTGAINFGAWMKTWADLVVMIIVCLLDAMLKLSSTENKLPVKVDKDYEVQIYGIGNFVTTLCGSSVGYMQLKFNVINFGVMGNVSDRMGGVMYALFCGVIFFWTTDLFNYLPRFFLSTLLFFAGSGFVAENLWGSRKYLSTAEWLQIFIILAVFILANSLLYAVITGGLLTGATFIFRYAKVPCVVGRPMRGGEGKSHENRTFLLQRKIQHVANSWILVMRLKGFLFFASAQKLTGWLVQHLEKQRESGSPAYQYTHWIIFDCTQLDGLDSSAAKAMAKVSKAAKQMKVVILWSGIGPDFVKQLKGCDVIENDSQVFATLEQARDNVEHEIQRYLVSQQAKWVGLHPMFSLAYETMKDRMALEPFEDILKLDTARFGCPWQYCSRLKLRQFSTLLWKAGEKRRTLFLVHSGKVGLFESIPDNLAGGAWEMPVAVFGRGQLLNREALLGLPTQMHAVALEDGELLCWSEVQWARMTREHPPMATALFQALMRQESGDLKTYKDQANVSRAVSFSEKARKASTTSLGKSAGTEYNFDIDSIAASNREELEPWLHGLHVTKGLAGLGLFEAPEASAGPRLTAPMTERIEKDLVIAFHTFKGKSAPGNNVDPLSDEHPSFDEHPSAELDDKDTVAVVPASKVGEALMYAGLAGLALTEGQVKDLPEAAFLSLGRELAVAPLSKQQVERVRSLYRKGPTDDDSAMSRAAAAGLLREALHPSLSVEEVDDLVSLCGGSSTRSVSDETFVAMLSRLVRRHEREWCVLAGARHLLGADEGDELNDRLTPSMLVENGMGTKLTLEEAEELLWSADICNEKGAGLDLHMVALALWPCDVPALELPPEPRSFEQDAVPGSTDHSRGALLADLRRPLLWGSGGKPPRLAFERAATGDALQEASVSEEEEEEVVEKEPYPSTCRARVHLFLDVPESSRAASRWSVVMGMLIMISVLTLFLEPLISSPDKGKELDPTEKAVWENFERFFTAVFTLEFLLRFAVADALGNQTFLGFLKTPMNICDIVAVIPWYVDLLIGSSQEEFRLFRIVRLTRLARLVRLGRLAKKSAMFAPVAVVLVVIWGIFMKNNIM